MRKLVLLVAFLLSCATIGVAQDSASIGLRFNVNSYDQLFQVESTQGLTVTGDVAFVKKEGLGFGITGQYTRRSFTNADDFYGGGPYVSVTFAKGFVTARAAANLGVSTQYNGSPYDFTRVYDISLRLNLAKHLYVTPVGLSFTRREDQIFSPAEKALFFEAGLRF